MNDDREQLGRAEAVDARVEKILRILDELPADARRQVVLKIAPVYADRRRYIPREQFMAMMRRTLAELERNASLEGRIEWSEMNGIEGHPDNDPHAAEHDMAMPPADMVAVRLFVRVGNDMGQGGAMMIEKGVGE